MSLRNSTVTLISVLLFVFCGIMPAQTTYVYVNNYSSNNISAYSVNRTTGFLTPVAGSPFTAGTNPIYLALDRQCRYVYAPNYLSNDLSSYVIDQNTGALTQLPGSPHEVGSNPDYSGMDSLGRFLYVPLQGPNVTGNTVLGYAINPDTGALTAVPGSPFTTGGLGPGQAIVDPSNRFVFVVNVSSNSVSAFSIDSSTGALSQVPGSPWATGGSQPKVLRTDRTGRFLYVSNRSNISIFSIDQNTGALSQVSGAPISVGSDLYTIAFDPSNKFAYFGDNGQGVYGFSLDNNSGLLTLLPGFPVRTDNPQGNPVFATDPRLGVLYMGSFLGSNTVSVWSINPNSGALSQIPGSSVPAGTNLGSIQTCSADADGAVARLYGNNLFNGNQTVNGNVTGSFFFGDGFGLMNLNPANLAAGTAGINITGAAATAGNAANLLGIPGSSYARLDVGNSFSGDQTITGNTHISGTATASSGVFSGQVTIGGGTPVAELISITQSITLPALNSSACTTFTTAPLTNFTPGSSDTLALGLPSNLVSGLGSGIYLIYQAWETTNTISPSITIQACNPTASRYKGGASGLVRIDVLKH